MAADKGNLIYILILFVPTAKTIRVGRLGRTEFKPGIYFYVGSGGRSAFKRLRRHLRSRKRKFWHIDYLTVHSEVIGAIIIEAPVSLECGMARAFSESFEPLKGFGCSDCSCVSHLFRAAVPASRTRAPQEV